MGPRGPEKAQNLEWKYQASDWPSVSGWMITLGFPGGSNDEESAFSAGVAGSIPGLGRSPEASDTSRPVLRCFFFKVFTYLFIFFGCAGSSSLASGFL